VHKLRVSNGHQVTSRAWPIAITRNPEHEQMSTALNLVAHDVLATMVGYGGDAPPYQGKVVALDRGSGRIEHVFNSLCSNRRKIINPSSCPSQRSAIWGRAGAVVDPGTHRVYATTGNGPFNGRTDWGDSVVELAPAAGRLLRHFTPTDQQRLNATDADLGSTSPALLPAPRGGSKARYLLQGGKDAKLRLLNLRSSCTGSPARPAGGSTARFSRSPRPVGTGCSRPPRRRAQRLPRGERQAGARALPAPSGHWNSPIIAGKRVFLPTGDANSHDTSGELSIYRIR
jgi:hypothetical protein